MSKKIGIDLKIIAKIRSLVNYKLGNYFDSEGFTGIDVPVLTRYTKDFSDTTFYIKSDPDLNIAEQVTKQFGHPVYLSTSAKLHLHSFVSGLSKVYCEGPVFQTHCISGKNSPEYWNFTCEEAFIDENEGYETLLQRSEFLFKKIIKDVYQSSPDLQKNSILQNFTNKDIDTKFLRIPYEAAIEIVRANVEDQYHCNILTNTGKTIICEQFNQQPVFITDFPPERRSFYCSTAEDSKTVRAFTLIVPRIGDVISGTVTEHDHKKLEQRLKAMDALDYFSWYHETLKWGVVPSGGFTIGLERLLAVFFPGVDIRYLRLFTIPEYSYR